MGFGAGRVALEGAARAATHGLGVLALTAGGVGAIIAESWLPGAVGAAGYAAIFAGNMVRRRFWRATLDDLRCRPPYLPSGADLMTSRAGRLAEELERTRSQRMAVLERCPPNVQKGCHQLQADVVRVESRAVDLIQRLDQLETLMVRQGAAPQKQNAAASSDDPRLSATLARIRCARDTRAAILSDLQTRASRLEAAIEAIVAALDVVPGRITAASSDHDECAVDKAGNELDVLVSELELQRFGLEPPFGWPRLGG